MINDEKITIFFRERLEKLYKLKNELAEIVDKSAEGKIYIKHDKKAIQYYWRKKPTDKVGEYISVNNKKLLKELVNKDYSEKILKIIFCEIIFLEKMLKANDYTGKYIDVYKKYPKLVREFITPISMPDEEYIKKWNDAEYVGKTIVGNGDVFITEKGEHVRSKSELNIANALYKYHVPYKYEKPLKFKNGKIIYPDFTILDIKNRREIYWEHRGMMDDREYARHSVQRIKEYMDNGICIWNGLIITEETSVCPLGTKEIKKVIDSILQGAF